MVTNATLYTLLQTIHANQTKYDIPELAEILAEVAALLRQVAALSTGNPVLIKEIGDLRAEIDSKLAILDAKLDRIIVQITPPETGDFNP